MITPNEISSKGEKLYKERFQGQYELSHPGQFLVIDVTRELAYVAESPEKALETAYKANPQGFFHVVRIGSPGVYRVGHTQGVSRAWHL
ncbi:MAG: hypothetical protein ACE14L_03645 [Terriglobales bacterium]